MQFYKVPREGGVPQRLATPEPQTLSFTAASDSAKLPVWTNAYLILGFCLVLCCSKRMGPCLGWCASWAWT